MHFTHGQTDTHTHTDRHFSPVHSLFPLKVSGFLDTLADEAENDVAIVHGDGQQRLDALPLEGHQAVQHQSRQLAQLAHHVIPRRHQRLPHVRLLQRRQHVLVEMDLSL